MKQIHRSAFLLALLVLFSLWIGCKKDDDTTGPPPAPAPTDYGNLTNKLSRYVAIGNSITAGYQSAAVSGRDQVYSFPKLLANHVGAPLEQPLFKEPGVGSRQRLVSLTGPVIVSETSVFPTDPQPYVNTPPAGAYDNLGIPGAVLGDILNTTDYAAQANPPRRNPFFLLVLRSSAIGRNILAQARSRNPTFMTCWIGNNDVLGYATSGGLSGTNLLPPAGTLPTEVSIFTGLYSQLLDSLKAIVDTNLVVANIPDVTSIPYFTTVGPSIRAALPAGIQFRYQRGTNRGLSFDSTRFAEATAPLITLPGISYASLLGRATGKFYRDNNITTLPAGIDTTKPFGFHPQNPWPTALTLDAGEITIAQAAVTGFNSAIASLAAARRIAVVDANAVLRSATTAAGL
jgi:hypothetical protein